VDTLLFLHLKRLKDSRHQCPLHHLLLLLLLLHLLSAQNLKTVAGETETDSIRLKETKV
jgi:hypothetical protein